MNLDWKKVALIVLFFLAVGAFAFFIYYFFFKPINQIVSPGNNENTVVNNEPLPTANINGQIYIIDTNTGLPISPAVNGQSPAPSDNTTATTPTAQVNALAPTNANFSTISATGELLFYNSLDGKFYRSSTDGKISVFNNTVFHSVSNVTWSNSKTQAILEYPDGSKIIYDFQNNKQITLPRHWQDFSFSSSDQQIVFKSIGTDPNNRYLVVAKADGSDAKTLEPITGKEDQFQANWSPNNQVVATFVDGKSVDQSEVYFIGLNNENFKSLVVDGRDFRGKWSPDGQRMLYSVYSPQNDYKPTLWITDAQGDNIGNNRRKINLETWSDKCSFESSDKLICAVPSSLSFGAGMDSAMPLKTSDQLYEINLITGTKKLIAAPAGDHAVGQIIIPDNTSQYFFFTDPNEQKIYKVQL